MGGICYGCGGIVAATTLVVEGVKDGGTRKLATMHITQSQERFGCIRDLGIQSSRATR